MKLSRPKLPLRKPSLGKGGGEAMRAPQVPPFAADVYRDLRDRRLLLPAIALLVAILAVPLVLASDPEPAVPPAAVAAAEDAEQVIPAVLAEQQVGVRDYRERLDQLKRTNPFSDKFGTSPATQDAAQEAIAPERIAAGGSGSVPSPAPSAGSEAPSDPAPSGPAPPADRPAPVTSPEPELIILAPIADVRFGKAGDIRRINRVEQGEMLPSRKKPILWFAGADPELTEASFFVSSAVTRSQGEGQCAPSRRDCQYLTLKVGEAQRFTYGNLGTIFRVKLMGLDDVEVDRRRIDGG